MLPSKNIQGYKVKAEFHMNVQILPAGLTKKAVLENLMQLYQYDFSEMCGDDCNEQGLFVDEHLPLYWIEPDRFPFLFQVDGKWAGFALVRRMVEIKKDPAPYSIAEFFIMRKYRRQGVGERAACCLFDRFPGKWHVAEIPENIAAIRFWRRVIAAYTKGQFEEVIDPDWEGPVQMFISKGQQPSE
jgi:predicted acetyltransferase